MRMPNDEVDFRETASTVNAAIEGQDFALEAGWITWAVLTLMYVVFFAQLTSFPMQDLPNHLARAVVLSDLIFHDGARFGHVFEFHPMLIPYSAGDAVLTSCVELLGPTA